MTILSRGDYMPEALHTVACSEEAVLVELHVGSEC